MSTPRTLAHPKCSRCQTTDPEAFSDRYISHGGLCKECTNEDARKRRAQMHVAEQDSEESEVHTLSKRGIRDADRAPTPNRHRGHNVRPYEYGHHRCYTCNETIYAITSYT